MRRIWMWIFFAVFLMLGGCGRGEEPAEVPDDGEYLIYYANSDMTRLVPHLYEAEAAEGDALVEELMDQFIHVPQDLDSQTAIRWPMWAAARKGRFCMCISI